MMRLLVTLIENVALRWQEWRERRRHRREGDVDVIEHLKGNGVR